MGLFFNQASSEYIATTATSGSATDIGGDYAISYWIDSNGGTNYGGVVWKDDSTNIITGFSGDARTYAYFQHGTDTAYIATTWAYGWHHFLWVRHGGIVTCYFDGQAVGVTDDTKATASAMTGVLEIGSGHLSAPPAAISGTVNGILHDVRLYKSPSWGADHAAMALAMFNGQGRDYLTDGLCLQACITEGVNQTVPTVIHDVSKTGLLFDSIIATPTYSEVPSRS